jgi:hypothetical protein
MIVTANVVLRNMLLPTARLRLKAPLIAGQLNKIDSSIATAGHPTAHPNLVVLRHSSLSSLQAPGYSLAIMPRLIRFLALAACFILAGAWLDGGYQRSTPDSLQAQGTIVDFERLHSRQVYPVFEFKDADGRPHRVVNSAQQGIVRFSRGDSVPIAYSRIDPERARIDTPWFSHRWVIGGIIVGLAIVIRALAGADLRRN